MMVAVQDWKEEATTPEPTTSEPLLQGSIGANKANIPINASAWKPKNRNPRIYFVSSFHSF